MLSPERVVVPKNILDELKCFLCSLPLSVPPIIYYNEQKLVCGRCSNKLNSNILLKYRVTAFEAVAKLLLFPCRYVSSGCNQEELQWGSVEAHENSCAHQPYECPVSKLQSCKWEGSSIALLEHFKEDHLHLLLKTDQFDASLHLSNEKIQLMLKSDFIFLVHLVISVKEDKAWFRINCVGKKNTARDVPYKLLLKTREDNNALMFKGSVLWNHEWKFDKNSCLELNLNSIKTVLNTDNVLCKVDFSEPTQTKPTKTPNINMEILNDLKCPNCLEFMVAPIFVCQNGHNICGKCKQKFSNCFTCKLTFGKTRNYILEKLTEHIAYPCRNKRFGCNFVGNSSTINSHQESCVLKTIECPLKESEECQWKDLVEHCSAHVLSKHPKKMSPLAETYRNLRSHVLIDFHLMIFKGQLFKVCCKHSLKPGGSISWAFQQVGLQGNEPATYKFEIEFLDQSRSGRKLVIDSLCLEITCDKDAFKDRTTLDYNLLAPFISDANYLTFRYNVSKV